MAGVVGVMFAVFVVLFPSLERVYLAQLAEKEASILTLAVEGLNGSLQRFENLPGLIAERPKVIAALQNQSDVELLSQVNTELQGLAQQVGLSDIFLIDETGLTIAASNHWKELSFVGRNFQFRPYFIQALAGEKGQFFALGTTSGERGYFFAAAVRDGADVIGVLAVKFTVDAFEDAWRADENVVAVKDDVGVVFMSNRSEWHFRSFAPLSESALANIEATRKYPLDALQVLENTRTRFNDDLVRVTVTGEDGQTDDFIAQSKVITDAGWVVWLFTPAAAAWNKAMGTIATISLLVLLIGLVVIVVIQRRVQLQERIAAALSMQQELEQRVTQRTAELKNANRNIMQEIEERRSAEIRLRQTQTELVQAGKLAALGQMSAALSHEFNQPLAAVKSFARNSLAYLDRGEAGKVRQNIGMIDEMVDRLVAISTHLRNFARRPGERTEPVLLNQAISSALAIAEPKLRAANCNVTWTAPDDHIWVLGGQVRLQQVFVNLLSNAVDAMAQVPDPVIEVTLNKNGAQVHVGVRDHGLGMTEANIENLFDPFYTTKEPGKGMGLGLSISYNIVRDFGGSLSGKNHPDGGAVFSVSLVQSDAPMPGKAAE
ncbi:MAG: ATP-binding protein [Paracoccaceae bacterium]